MDELRGKRVTVAGLGHFGGNIAASRWLVDQGAVVTVTDMAPPEKLAESVKQLDGVPITWRLGEHHEDDFTKTDLVIASPAIPLSNEYLQAAKKAGVPVTTEIRLLIEPVGDGTRSPAVGRNHGQPAVRVKVELLSHRRTKHDRFAVGRPLRICVGTWLADDLPDRTVGEREHVQIRRDALDEIRIQRGAERDARAVRRPFEAAD